MMDRFSALSLGEKIILVAGIALFIFGFFPWYDVDLGIVSITRNGWESPGAMWSILAILIGLAMAAVVAVRAFVPTANLPDQIGGLGWPQIMLGAGVLTVILVVIKFLNESSELGIGFFLGFIAAIALAVGGYLMYAPGTIGQRMR
jgi:hypothetical protein